MPGLHAKLAPSSSKRWMACTAAPLYVESLISAGTIPPESTSRYAEEGTEAHDWASNLLLGKVKPEKIPANFQPHIIEYHRVCLECEHEAGEGSYRLVESKVPLFYSPDETGTVDYAFVRVVSDILERIYVRDLKYGAGVPVDAEENTQLAIYALSLIEDLETWWGPVPDHVEVSIGIHQPRYAGDDSLKLWETTVGELKQFCEPIRHTAILIQSASEGVVEAEDQLEFHPSADVCQFCQAKAICKARLQSAFEHFPADPEHLALFNNMDLPAVDSVEPETLVALWQKKKDIAKYLTDVEEYLTALATAGTPAEGTKLVEGREGNRAWKDDKLTEKTLVKYLPRSDIYIEKLISPAQAEKLLKENAVAKPVIETHMKTLTERPEGKMVLAPENDKRPAVEPAIKHFSLITDDSEE